MDMAKVRLNVAVSPGAWLMPARMVINTGSVVGYNNQLKEATPGMKLGIRNDVNQSSNKAVLHVPDGRWTFKDPPAKQPSVKPNSPASCNGKPTACHRAGAISACHTASRANSGGA